jgi:hypothetical protein
LARDHYKMFFNAPREFIIVAEPSDGKTLETILRTKEFSLKMLIRKAVIELRSLGGSEVQRCAVYSVAS